MSNPFDETLKHLVETQPSAWLEYVGMPGRQAEVIDADLSTLTAEADKVIKVRARKSSLVHLEWVRFIFRASSVGHGAVRSQVRWMRGELRGP
jgi:hypothetical protein